MIKNWRFKGVLLAVLIAFALVLGVTSNGYAGAEPGDNEKIVGKSINAVLTAILITPEAPGLPYVVQVIAGWCNKEYFVFGPMDVYDEGGAGFITPGNFDSIQAQCSDVVLNCLEDYVLDDLGPIGCYSDLGGETLIITDVKNFINNGTVISAEITMQMLETK